VMEQGQWHRPIRTMQVQHAASSLYLPAA
jgi:hypothetical protein